MSLFILESKKFSKREYKNRKKDSDYSDDESYHSKIGNTKKDDSHTNNQISVTSKKSSKRKYRYKKRAPLFENDEKENHKDLENYNLIVKAVEKKDNICDVKILNAVKGSSVYLRNKKENKNSLNTMLKEIVNDNVSCVKISENSNSSSSRGILKNSTSAVHSIKEHTPTKDITPIFSTPRKTEFDGFGCENDVSAIAFHRVSKLNVSDDICEKRSIESVAESTFRSENSICSQNRNSPDIFNHSLENTDLSIVNKTPAFTELPPVQKIKKLTNNNSVIDYDLSSNNLSHSNENLSPCKENESRTVFSEIKPNNASQNKFTCDSIDNKEQQINNEKKFDSDLYIHKTRSNFHKFGNNLANIIILEENESIIELMDNTIEPQFTPDILEEIVNCNTITMRKTSIMPSSDEDVTIRDTENTRFIDENVTIEDFNKSHSIDGNVSIEDFDKSHSIVDAENAIIDENLTIKNFENTHFIDENVTIEDFNKSHSIVDSENATNCQDFHSVMEETAAVQDFENSFTLLSGKKWQRSQNLIRNFNVTNMTLNELDRTLKMDGLRRGRKYREGVERVYNLQNKSGD